MATKSKSAKRYDAAQAFLRNLKPPEGEPDTYWEKTLELNDKQRIMPTLRNAVEILTMDSNWKGVLAFDEFANDVVKTSAPPWKDAQAGPWSDSDDSEAMIWLSHHYEINFEHKTLLRAVNAAANRRRVHPVREYFAGLKWDGTPRVQKWLHTYLGSLDDEYARAVGTKFLVSAVARVMRPGCKADNVLILEGEQGRWKSTALSVLAGAWFMDTPFTLGDKDAFLVIRGSLIVELAELDGFSRAESSRAKAFFSSPADTFVPKYVARAVRVPRQCVFVGTVNHGTYLRDTTGNRRYWPVRIDRGQIDELRADRDQIWAEAVHLYEQGQRWWVEPEEQQLFAVEQELRYVGDAYADRIAAWAVGKSEFTMEKVLSDALKLDVSKWTRAEQTRVGEVLQELGWEHRRYGTGKRGRYYVKRERVPGQEG